MCAKYLIFKDWYDTLLINYTIMHSALCIKTKVSVWVRIIWHKLN
jgi:hypothetical protein